MPILTKNHQGIGRRAFLRQLGAGSVALGLTGTGWANTLARPIGSNGDVRVAVVGVGSKEAVGGVGGRGRQLISSLLKVPGVRIVALCDVDRTILESQAQELKKLGQAVATYGDLRRVFEDPAVDAVVVATPNHWHALATIWACQAGKDVYVEKPVSHSIWEGRQMVAAARKYGRIVQAGTQARSSAALQEAFAWIQNGELGAIRFARIILYRQRSSIGKVTAPTAIPSSVDYDLWCGPAEKQPLRRKQLHYDWHWGWSAGSGEMGNNGVHYVDMCRWVMKLDSAAPGVVSLGGRFGFDDDGETPNTQVAVLNFPRTPIYCEIRALPQKKDAKEMDSFLNTKMGLVLQCEGGYFSGAHLAGSAFDNAGKEIRKFGPIPWGDMDTGHLANFIDAVRSRKSETLKAEILEGHLSAACCHQVNISHRLGKSLGEGGGLEWAAANPVASDAIARYREHLEANGIDYRKKESLGPWLAFDTKAERFVGEASSAANALLKRKYRKPFVVRAIS